MLVIRCYAAYAVPSNCSAPFLCDNMQPPAESRVLQPFIFKP